MTKTEYDSDDKPVKRQSEVITNQEAEEYMGNKKNDLHAEVDTSKESTPIDNNTVTEADLKSGEQLGVQDGREKPASQMSEADAVALNSDVHLATPQQSPRVVTQGQVDQVETDLHPDATEGKPLVAEDEANEEKKAPSEDLHVREPSKS